MEGSIPPGPTMNNKEKLLRYAEYLITLGNNKKDKNIEAFAWEITSIGRTLKELIADD